MIVHELQSLESWSEMSQEENTDITVYLKNLLKKVYALAESLQSRGAIVSSQKQHYQDDPVVHIWHI